MPDFDTILRLLCKPLEFWGRHTPDNAPAGRARLYYDEANDQLKASTNGAAYQELVRDSGAGLTGAQVAEGTLGNGKLAVPKLVAYQETVLFSQFADGGGAAGTYDLQHSIPAGAVYARSTIHALTGFAGDTSAVLTIGDGTDVDRYNTGTPDVFTTAAAGVDLGAPSGALFHAAAKTPRLTITSGADWGAVSAGALTVTLFYYRPV